MSLGKRGKPLHPGIFTLPWPFPFPFPQAKNTGKEKDQAKSTGKGKRKTTQGTVKKGKKLEAEKRERGTGEHKQQKKQ